MRKANEWGRAERWEGENSPPPPRIFSPSHYALCSGVRLYQACCGHYYSLICIYYWIKIIFTEFNCIDKSLRRRQFPTVCLSDKCPVVLSV